MDEGRFERVWCGPASAQLGAELLQSPARGPPLGGLAMWVSWGPERRPALTPEEAGEGDRPDPPRPADLPRRCGLSKLEDVRAPSLGSPSEQKAKGNSTQAKGGAFQSPFISREEARALP